MIEQGAKDVVIKKVLLKMMGSHWTDFEKFSLNPQKSLSPN